MSSPVLRQIGVNPNRGERVSLSLNLGGLLPTVDANAALTTLIQNLLNNNPNGVQIGGFNATGFLGQLLNGMFGALSLCP